MSKTIKRNWLMEQIELGKVEAKCDIKLTDDYAFDNATNFGETDWFPAYIRKPVFEEFTLENGSVINRCTDHDWRDNAIALMTHDFSGKSGYAIQNNDGTYGLKSAGTYYTLRII